MPAHLHHLAPVQDADPGGPLDGGQAVGDHQGGAVLHEHLQGLLDRPLTFGVQGAGGLVQDQDGRILEQGPGDGQALALAAGQGGAGLRQGGVVALGQGADEVVGVGLPGGRLHRLPGRRLAVGDVVVHGIHEQQGLLGDDADALAQLPGVELPQVDAVQGHPAAGGVEEPGHQVHQGGLAAAGAAHQGDGLALAHLQVDPPQHLVAARACPS